MSSIPPPPPGPPPGPPGSYGSDRPAVPPPPPSYQAPPSVTWGLGKPPPPRCPVGAWLMIGGGLAVIIGCFLPWFTILGESVNGFTDLGPGGGDEASDGYVFAVLGAAVLAFGITTLFAKRLLPIAILAVVLASFCALASIADLGDVADLSDLFDVSVGVGLPLILIGSLLGLAGGIVALATRRR